LRPASSADAWAKLASDRQFGAHADAALQNVSVIEAAHAEEESLAVAVALREVVNEGKTAALVTPDRALGRRVLAALTRWNIAAEDSGGEALATTPAGIFARLAAEVALDGLAPVPLLSLLKHPLFRLGSDGRAVAALERAVLRGPRPRPGSNNLAHALKTFREELAKFRRKEPTDLHGSDPRVTLHENELAAAAGLVAALGAALARLEDIAGQSLPLGEIAARHRDVVAALSEERGKEAAFAGADGVKLAEAFEDLSTSEAAAALAVDTNDYAELFVAALEGRQVRPAPRAGVRVRILGTVEARLTDSDRVVLGGLVEGTWPPESLCDAWLSRPMRQQLGLDQPERRIGLTAHDFAQLLGAPEVILSYPAKTGGAPTVPSRFVQRLAAIAGKERWQTALDRGNAYVGWARELDRPGKISPEPQPAPKPPREVRPPRLSVTDIENWLRDPYTIYAKYILKLAPLDPVDMSPGAAERGTVIHAAVGEFTERYAAGLPPEPERILIEIGVPHFAPLEDFPETRAFWWPRFRRIARWFAAWEAQRRPGIKEILAEIRGEIDVPLSDGVFKLVGRADRIEQHADGRYVILDYKTGSARSERQVRTGLAPQLTLEAAILRRGGFPGIAPGSVAQVGYVLLKGGARPGEPKLIDFKDDTTDNQADYALQRLTEIARRFDDQNEPYRSLVHPMWTTHYGDYDHLARVKEWSATGGEIDDFWGSE
jgi:ATP-dependent helicase/nuclease subunit B